MEIILFLLLSVNIFPSVGQNEGQMSHKKMNAASTQAFVLNLKFIKHYPT